MHFSIVICTYNRASMLSETLLSMCQLEFDFTRFEILLIDNNSSDQTPEVFQYYEKKYPNLCLRYIKETNQGISYARNRGIEEAKGEFIIYIDDDETVNKDYLNILDQYLIENTDIEYAASIITPIYEGGEPKWMSPFTQRLIGGYFYEGDQIKKLKKNKYPGTGHTIIRKELYTKHGMYNTNLGRKGKGLMGAEDKDMALRLLEASVECYYLPIPVFHHIPPYKLTDEFFSELTYSIGKSERIRTRSISSSAFIKRLLDEVIKWAGSVVLCVFYTIKLQPTKGTRLLHFRWNVSKGLLGR